MLIQQYLPMSECGYQPPRTTFCNTFETCFYHYSLATNKRPTYKTAKLIPSASFLLPKLPKRIQGPFQQMHKKNSMGVLRVSSSRCSKLAAVTWGCGHLKLQAPAGQTRVKVSLGGPEDMLAHSGHSHVKMAEGSFLASSVL